MAKQKIEGKQKQNSYLLRLLEAVGPIRFLLVDKDQLQVGVVVLVLKLAGPTGLIILGKAEAHCFSGGVHVQVLGSSCRGLCFADCGVSALFFTPVGFIGSPF